MVVEMDVCVKSLLYKKTVILESLLLTPSDKEFIQKSYSGVSRQSAYVDGTKLVFVSHWYSGKRVGSASLQDGNGENGVELSFLDGMLHGMMVFVESQRTTILEYDHDHPTGHVIVVDSNGKRWVCKYSAYNHLASVTGEGESCPSFQCLPLLKNIKEKEEVQVASFKDVTSLIPSNLWKHKSRFAWARSVELKSVERECLQFFESYNAYDTLRQSVGKRVSYVKQLREEEERRQAELKRKEELKRKREEERKKQEEKRKQEELRKQCEELKRKREEEERRKQEELKRKQEELRKQCEELKRKREEEERRKQEELKRKREEEERKQQEEEKQRKEAERQEKLKKEWLDQLQRFRDELSQIGSEEPPVIQQVPQTNQKKQAKAKKPTKKQMKAEQKKQAKLQKKQAKLQRQEELRKQTEQRQEELKQTKQTEQLPKTIPETQTPPTNTIQTSPPVASGPKKRGELKKVLVSQKVSVHDEDARDLPVRVLHVCSQTGKITKAQLHQNTSSVPGSSPMKPFPLLDPKRVPPRYPCEVYPSNLSPHPHTLFTPLALRQTVRYCLKAWISSFNLSMGNSSATTPRRANALPKSERINCLCNSRMFFLR